MTTTTMQILGKTYEVQFLDDTAMMGSLGSANREKAVIKINVDVSDEQVQDSILHEVVHILDMELKLGLSEETVARLGAGLFSAGIRADLDIIPLANMARNPKSPEAIQASCQNAPSAGR